VTTPAVTLAFLAYHWGDAYVFSVVKDRWVALRRDARYFLTAETLAGLETVIEADYGCNPVPRDYDPPGAAGYLNPALPGILPLPGYDYADDDAGLDADTLIIAGELRRAFPLWTIIYSTQTHTWIGRTRKTTLSHNSAVSLCIALTLIERRQRQLAHDSGWEWPPPDDGTPG
jgi:hypothetical protein